MKSIKLIDGKAYLRCFLRSNWSNFSDKESRIGKISQGIAIGISKLEYQDTDLQTTQNNILGITLAQQKVEIGTHKSTQT